MINIQRVRKYSTLALSSSRQLHGHHQESHNIILKPRTNSRENCTFNTV